MNNIGLIIGNGFDISLGLKTSFGDFIENSSDFNNLISEGNMLCTFLKKANKNSRWIDVEKELTDYSRNNPNDDALFDEYKKLKNALYNYIAMVDTHAEIKKDSNAVGLIRKYYTTNLNKQEEIRLNIVNFNYTSSFHKAKKADFGKKMGFIFDIVEVIGSFAGNLDHLRITYPHGSIDENYIIFGVEDSADISKEHIFLKKSCDRNYKRFPIQLNNCDKIIFFGHSLGKTDHTYFKDFFLKQCEEGAKPKDIRISYYKEKGYYQIMEQLDVLTNNQIGALKNHNNLKLIDVSKNGAYLEF